MKHYSLVIACFFYSVSVYGSETGTLILRPTFDPVVRPDGSYLFNNLYDDEYLDQKKVSVLYQQKKGERLDVCYTFAITEVLGISGKAPTLLPVSRSADLITECDVINKYYQQVIFPHEGDLVVYTDDNYLINHFALVTNIPSVSPYEMRVKSKHGTIIKILETALFGLSLQESKNAFFYHLIDPYCNDKLLMLAEMQKDIQQSKAIIKRNQYISSLFLRLANGEKITNTNDAYFNKQKIQTEKMSYLLLYCMGLDINTKNCRGKTPLMLAARRADTPVVGELLAMNAEFDEQDNDGNTALSLACKKSTEDHIYVAYLLLRYGASHTIVSKKNKVCTLSNKTIMLLNTWKGWLLQLALNEKIDINFIKGESPADQMRFLLKDTGPRIDLSFFYRGFTLLDAAIYTQNTEVINLLLERGIV